jgi:hypothetical protein
VTYRSTEDLDVVVLLAVDGFGDGAANTSGASCDCDSGHHYGVTMIDVQVAWTDVYLPVLFPNLGLY